MMTFRGDQTLGVLLGNKKPITITNTYKQNYLYKKPTVVIQRMAVRHEIC